MTKQSPIPVDKLYHVTLVTDDARSAAYAHGEFYGIDHWKIFHATPARLTNTTIFGRTPTAPPDAGVQGKNPVPGEYSFISATGSTANGAITIQIVQPTGGLSTFEEFLVTRGTGIHGVCLSAVASEELAGIKQLLAQEGVRLAQSYVVEGVCEHYYFDTRALLGFYLQVDVPLRSDWQDHYPTDEEWDFSSQITPHADAEVLKHATGFSHLGVVVRDVRSTVEAFWRLFDQPLWRGMHWRTAPGSLEDTTNNGQPVVHGYFTGRGNLCQNHLDVPFGFEIIQPTFGPSHYKEDFLDLIGPGIHHADVRVPMDWAQWEALNTWLANDFQAPTCMSGWLRNRTALFQYQNTSKSLGYVTEIVAPPQPGKKFGGPSAPDYWYDFRGYTEE